MHPPQILASFVLNLTRMTKTFLLLVRWNLQKIFLNQHHWPQVCLLIQQIITAFILWDISDINGAEKEEVGSIS